MVNKLRMIRKEKKISGYEMAKILGYKSAATYYKKEKGELPITYEEMKIISNYLKEPATKIFFSS